MTREQFDARELAELIVTLRPDWNISVVAEFEYLPGGYSNDNYRFELGDPAAGKRRSCVLRVPRRPRPFVDRDVEQAFYRSAAGSEAFARDGSGLIVPQVLAFDSATGLMITDWIEGPLLTDLRPESAKLPAFVQALQAALPSTRRAYDPLALSRQYLAAGAPDPLARRLADSLTWRPRASRTCHNDLNPWNIICTPSNGWAALDWELLGSNDPIFDLVTLHQGLGLPASELPGLMPAFTAGRPDNDRLQDCLIAFWLREYAWAHAEREHGDHRPEIQDQLGLALGKLRLLADA